MISFVVTTKNEGQYIETLLSQLNSIKAENDEIIVVDDYSDDLDTINILDKWSHYVKLYKHNLNNDFASHKNFAISKATQPWIFQIDADETLSDHLAQNLHTLLEYNSLIDLFLVPRINIVEGLTENDIAKWNWRVNAKNHVMWPDYQTRIFRRTADIKWVNKVHERIVGYQTVAQLPAEEDWALIHIKDIARQRKQNEFYARI